jgi:5'-nucleotidase
MDAMFILQTNDDGILAPGLLALHREIKSMGEIAVVAPEQVQSATGHGITLSQPLLTEKVTVENGFEGISVDGRPADCVKLAIDQLLPRRPDLVVSGMNLGANTGINVVYSGTVAAAIEAAFLGLPAIAVSLHLKGQEQKDYAWAAKWGAEVVRMVWDRGVKAGQVVSINIPALRVGEEPAGVKVCRQCVRPWADTYERRKDPRGRDYFWNSSVFVLGNTEDDTDVAAVRDRYVAVTPLQFDLTNYPLLKDLQSSTWKLTK